MSKRGDPVAKAFAGSLHAAHDEEITLVGNFTSDSFGTTLLSDAEMENRVILLDFKTIRISRFGCCHGKIMLNVECVSFTWKGGFVCTGPKPSPPDEWLDDVLGRSRFSFTKSEDLRTGMGYGRHRP